MTLKQASMILIRSAGSDVTGVGCGIRTAPSYQQQVLIKHAAVKVFKHFFKREPDDNELWNWGFK